jgi:nucleoside-diphosphate-sugar epimerase
VKILLTGSNGFLGNNILQKLKEYDITAITRNDLDLCDTKKTDLFFSNNKFDVVIHCAIDGGNRLLADESSCLYQNTLMALNLQKNKSSFKKLIHFGSGAELDRSLDIAGNENNIYNRVPSDFYGLSKNIIARIFDNEPNFYNLRIFNVFAEDEAARRMIKSNVSNYIEDKPMIIHLDKLMDFFYIDDFIAILKLYIEDKCFIKEVDCVYREKVSLSQIAYKINQLSNHKVPVVVNSGARGNSYTGNYCIFFDQVRFLGLEHGIRKVYESLL